MVIKTDLAIIGGGVAGFSAAMYAGRLGLKPTIFDAKMGGTVILTDTIENYPGFIKLSGMELSNKLKEHAMVFNPKLVNAYVQKISRKGNCFHVYTKKEIYHVKAIIIATGTIWKKLKVKGEKELSGKGVHYCALCDGPLYKDKLVGVVGGADSAIKESIQLSKIAKKIFIINRSKKIRPEPINLERLKKLKNVKIINNTNIMEILGNNKVERVKLDNEYKGSNELMLDAVFIDIGHIPITEIVKDIGVKLNKKGEVIADKLMNTNVPGVFPAGDVTDTPFKQAIIAAAQGATAAFSAYDHITKNPLCISGDEVVIDNSKIKLD